MHQPDHHDGAGHGVIASMIGVQGLGQPVLKAISNQYFTLGMFNGLAISTTIVDTSPFSTNGALVVANTPQQEREKVLRSLLIYSAVIALVGPCVAWLTLVVPGVL
ncbi:hypothetical protein [Pseudomonas fluorescens]|uniref:Uncharacterized protein n=1 Tax=Pseudomonas fluorescens TaxID=294 RepID=A0A5E7FHU1_PSEFL|nr:hypothetical protein [Pseudomonas fluorescens]VVO36853.1 hypothetical protein PS710_05491 [Pseudomonas fluorescens]